MLARVLMPKRYVFFTLLVLVVGLLTTVRVVSGQSTRVSAILFYSPSCGHCQKVIQEDLPPLIEQYGDQLSILAINVSAPEGQQLYQNAVQQYNIPDERIGVPCLIVGDTVLVGSQEIPEIFPQIIESGLSASGIDWPDIPGLQEVIPPVQSNLDSEENVTHADTNPDQPVNDLVHEKITIQERFRQDLIGNSLAVIVLLGMIGSVIGISYIFLKVPAKETRSWPNLTIPILAIAGIFVAGYLSFVEVTQTEAVCGPVGDCNTVQQSSYAVLFGIIPIGLLGVIGYILILITWAISSYGPNRWTRYAAVATWVISFSGVLFSIYLTFLEPFIIGATCAWCLASAIIITLIFWAASGEVKLPRNIDPG